MAARPSRVDACMFCGNTPCTCNAKPKTGSRKRTVPIVTESNGPPVRSSSSSDAQKAAATSAMRAAAKVHHTGATVKEDSDAVDEMDAILSDPEMILALRATEPLMHPLERKKYAAILNSEPSAKERAIVWKRRVAGE